MRQTVFYLLELLSAMLIFAPFYTAARLFGVRRLLRRGLATNVRHETGCALFWALGFGIFEMTVLRELITVSPCCIAFTGFSSDPHLNLKLFEVFRLIRIETFERGKWSFFLVNFVGNIAVFIPLGLLICLVWRKPSVWKALGLGLGFSLFIELCQYPIGRGTDVDDLWLNTLGALTGWLIFLVIKKRGHDARWRVSPMADAVNTSEEVQ